MVRVGEKSNNYYALALSKTIYKPWSIVYFSFLLVCSTRLSKLVVC